ncbi:leucine-rich repeat protein [Berryella wangjianweii]|uniref:Leucine-rich repeat protein n=1 Tax=Berryella wangjianweii TaxID=2734634 RepID=A0A6M8IY25_9ACTN|nr:leucine-rich repeat protein [Berryella wangjianweii]QKF07765.1 leucine-rich repeat protein [Berryella wangjianweii]
MTNRPLFTCGRASLAACLAVTLALPPSMAQADEQPASSSSAATAPAPREGRPATASAAPGIEAQKAEARSLDAKPAPALPTAAELGGAVDPRNEPAVGPDERSPFSTEQLLSYAGSDPEPYGDPASASPEAERAEQASDDEPVVIVVQLEPEAQPPTGPLAFFSAKSSVRDTAKRGIRRLASEAGADASIPRETPALANGWNLFSAPETADDPDLREYFHVIEGFTVKAPASMVDDIRALEGVRNAFVERSYRPAEVPRAAAADAQATPQALEPQADGSTARENQAALSMTGADRLSQKGDGTVVAVIDSGVDTAHTAFSGDLDDDTLALTRDRLKDLRGDLSEDGKGATYVSEKIPFAYDYADHDSQATPLYGNRSHGTHVAGIATANAGETRGTAPNAQLLAMKVSRDLTGDIFDSAILAALDDCAVLGADVVNLSLGSDGGFSDEAANTFSDAFDALRDRGAVVSVAAGNSYSAAQGNLSGSSRPYATDPDSGIACSPGTLATGLAVASANNAVGNSYFTASDGATIPFVPGTLLANAVGKSIDAALADRSYRYLDAGKGLMSDVRRLRGENPQGFSDKILLLEDDEVDDQGRILLTAQRVENLATLRPAAIVVFPRTERELSPLNVGTVSTVPAVCITRADGLKLRGLSQQTLAFKPNSALPPAGTYRVSDFSSWGPSPELALKPEIMAPGGNIWAPILKDRYGFKSGTSMATPYVAGVSAAMEQFMRQTPRYASLSGPDRAARATQLLMSTATPLELPGGSGAYYSPRQQGAGLIAPLAAQATQAYLSVAGTAGERPKAELGESAQGTWTFTVRVHNQSDTPLTFEPRTAAQSEGVENGLFNQRPQNYAGNGITVTYQGAGYDAASNRLTVAPGTTELKVTLTCEQSFKDAMAAAVNGTFVDGFLFLKPVGAGQQLSLPFLGFYGAWNAAPVFDASLYGGQAPHLVSTKLMNGSTGYPLGLNPLDPTAHARALSGNYTSVDGSKLVVSNQNFPIQKWKMPASPNQALPNTGLLRGAKSLEYRYVRVSDGEVVRSYRYSYLSKSKYLAAKGGATVPEDTLRRLPLFNGLDKDSLKLTDGAYRLDIVATTAGPGSTERTQSIPFTYDTTDPRMTRPRIEGSGDSRQMVMTVSDEGFVAGVYFSDPATGAYFHRVLADRAQMTEADGKRVYTFRVPLTELQKAWNSAGKSGDVPANPLVVAWDYGLNHTDVAGTSYDPKVSNENGFLINRDTGELVGYVGTSTVLAIPEGVTSIAPGALKGKAIQGVTFPASLKTIGADALADIPTLTDVAFAPGSALESIGARAFANSGSPNLAVTLPEGLKSIEQNAFANTRMATVTLPSTLTEVPVGAFEKSQVSTVVMTEGLKTVGKGAFEGCARLSAVKTLPAAGGQPRDGLPHSLDSIGARAFANTGLDEVDLGTGVTHIGSDAFRGSPIERIAVPDSVTRLDSGALGGMTRLVDAKVGTGLSADALIGAFRGCTALKKIEAAPGAQVASVDGVLFSADKRRLIAFPAAKAPTYEVPAGTERIEADAFTAASTHTVTLPEGLRSIGPRAFAASVLEGALRLPDSIEQVGERAFEVSRIESVNLGGAKEVGDSAFARCESLTNVSFGSRLTTIGASAFNRAPLAGVELPDTVTTVGDAAFANNGALKRVHLGAGITDDYARLFAGCDGIEQVSASDASATYAADRNVLYRKAADGLHALFSPAANAFESYTVKPGTTVIEKGAFRNNRSLKSLVLPEGLLRIESAAFNGCSSLSDVVFPDSLQDVNGLLGTAMEVADFGTKISRIHGNAFGGHVPAHLVVRGGVFGAFTNSTHAGSDRQPMKSAYFGEGMESVDFAANPLAPPPILVVPSTLTTLKLRDPRSYAGAKDIVVYAPAGTTGWNTAAEALRARGIQPDDAHLRPYTPLKVTARASAEAVAGARVTVTAAGAQGVPGGYDYRFVQVGADGTRTVVRDWDAAPSFEWSVPADAAKLVAEVRDPSYYTVGAEVEVPGASQPGPAPQPGPNPGPAPSDASWNRLQGNVALDTMQKIVREGWSGQTGGAVVLATSEGYWDALTAAGLAGLEGAPVLMTASGSLSDQTRGLLKEMAPTRVYLAGGSAAVSDAVADQVRAVTGVQPERVMGATATGTAVQIFKRGASVGRGWGNEAIIATNDGYWDALAAAPYAYAKRIPILLTEGSSSIAQETLDALRDAGITKVRIMGGTAAVSRTVEQQLASAGISVEQRFAGQSAVHTALLFAQFELEQGMTVRNMGVATNDGYWDALAGAALCGSRNSVLALVDDAKADLVAEFARRHQAELGRCYVFGGTAAVSPHVFDMMSAVR